MEGKRGRSGAGWGGAAAQGRGGSRSRGGDSAGRARSCRRPGWARLRGGGACCGTHRACRAPAAPLLRTPPGPWVPPCTPVSRLLNETRPVSPLPPRSSAGAEQAAGTMKILGKNLRTGRGKDGNCYIVNFKGRMDFMLRGKHKTIY